jgi:hypothetical protein
VVGNDRVRLGVGGCQLHECVVIAGSRAA